MTLKPSLSISRGRLLETGCAASLLLGAAFLPLPAAAQDGGQQLPQAYAEEQVPSAFPDDNGQPQDIMGGSGQIINTPSENAQAAQAVQQQEAADAPAPPEERRLVPATAMGTDARGGVPNPVEDAAAAAAERDAASAPAMPDILEQYTQRSNAMSAQNQGAGGDALPQVQRQTQVRLEGDFGLGTDNTVMPIDGDLMTLSNEELQEQIRTEAFDAAITGMFPLSPEQIQRAIRRYDETQAAATNPPYKLPTPEVSVQNVSLDPGTMPPSIKTAVGNVTTLNILDATGAPWPVQDVTWAGDYEVVEPEEGGHIIRITPMSHFARGNIVIRLLTLKTPLTMTLETGRDVVQYRVDARIPEYGPFANAPLMQGGKSMVAGSSELTSILDGVAPSGAARLTVVGVDGRTTAYSMGGTTYVRTPLTLLSPAWQSSVSSADGMNVYALSNAPVLLLSDGGEFMRAVLKEKEDLLDE